jgi:FixJ family two-component response regulator
MSSNTAQEKPTVFVVDDDISVRESLELLIRFAGWEPETFASAREFLARPRALTPSCLVLDVSLPDLNGLDLQKLVADRTDMPIIFITGYGDVPMTVRAMKAGAVEFLSKPFDDQVLLDAIHAAIERDRQRRRHAAQLGEVQARYRELTEREREIFGLVAGGQPNKRIAAGLGLSVVTVKVHRAQVMRKMAAKSIVDLARMADQLGLPRTA